MANRGPFEGVDKSGPHLGCLSSSSILKPQIQLGLDRTQLDEPPVSARDLLTILDRMLTSEMFMLASVTFATFDNVLS